MILYGCGDFINDYEGIGVYKWFRPDLSLMYLIEIEKEIKKLIIFPFKIKNFRLNYAEEKDIQFVYQTLKKEIKFYGELKIVKNYLLLEC